MEICEENWEKYTIKVKVWSNKYAIKVSQQTRGYLMDIYHESKNTDSFIPEFSFGWNPIIFVS